MCGIDLFLKAVVFQVLHDHVIDNCIEVIIGLPDIRSNSLVHRIPSCFDTPEPANLDTQICQEEEEGQIELQSTPLSTIKDILPPKNTAPCRGTTPCTLIDIKRYKGSNKLIWTEEGIEAFHFLVSNCQTRLLPYYKLMHPTMVYMYMAIKGQIRVVRFFSKSLTGSQLNWSAKEKECYGIYYDVKLFEDLLDSRYFIQKTDHMNLTYSNVTFTGKMLRWKLYLKDKDFDLYHGSGTEEHQFVPDDYV